jgi:hypothetical protein
MFCKINRLGSSPARQGFGFTGEVTAKPFLAAFYDHQEWAGWAPKRTIEAGMSPGINKIHSCTASSDHQETAGLGIALLSLPCAIYRGVTANRTPIFAFGVRWRPGRRRKMNHQTWNVTLNQRDPFFCPA